MSVSVVLDCRETNIWMEGDVAGEHEAVPVDDGIERGGGAETGGVLDGQR